MTTADSVHAMTFRMEKGMAADLAAIAAVENIPIVQLVREMVHAGIIAKRADPEFQRRLTTTLERSTSVMQRLQAHE